MFSVLVAGLIVSAVSTGIGLYNSYKARKESEAEMDRQRQLAEAEAKKIEKQEQEAAAWYASERNKPTMEREENRAAMSSAVEAAEEQNKKAESRAAIMGGSSEAAVAQRANNMKIIAGMARDISAAGAQYRQNLDSQYLASKASNSQLRAQNLATSASISSSYISALNGVSSNASQLTSNAINAGGAAVSDYFKSTAKPA